MQLKDDILNLRKDYQGQPLTMDSAHADPYVQFDHWFEQARAVDAASANAMSVATVDDAGLPNCRTVLMKSFNEQGFVFFTDYSSAKGQELAHNAGITALFWWRDLERQVRIRGQVDLLSVEDSTHYFQSRPKGSQISATASHQSQTVSLDELQSRQQALEQQYADADYLPKPERWGGYLIQPVSLEFWQGRPNRLHDRLLYTQQDQCWQIERLSP